MHNRGRKTGNTQEDRQQITLNGEKSRAKEEYLQKGRTFIQQRLTKQNENDMKNKHDILNESFEMVLEDRKWLSAKKQKKKE